MWKRYIVALLLVITSVGLRYTSLISSSGVLVAYTIIPLVILGLTWRENALVFAGRIKIKSNPYLVRIIGFGALASSIIVIPLAVDNIQIAHFFRLSVFMSLSAVVFGLGNITQSHLLEKLIKIKDKSLSTVGKVEVILSLSAVLSGLLAFVYYTVIKESSILDGIVIAISCLLVQSVDVLTIGSDLIARIGLMTSTKNNVLLSNAINFTRSTRVTDVVFSKRGVLTFGDLAIGTVAAAQPDKIIKIASSLEQGVDHPIARVINRKLSELQQSKMLVKRQEFHPGKGVSGVVDGQEYIFGNLNLMHDFDIALGMLQREKIRLEGEGETVLILARTGGRALGSHNRRTPGEVMGLVSIVDKLRPEVRSVFARLAKLGLKVWVLSGDSQATVEALGLQSGATKERLIAEVSSLKQSQAVALIAKKAKGLVALVGDGEADSVALKSAPFSIAFSADLEGGDLARDVFIKGERLDSLLYLFSTGESVTSLLNKKNIIYIALNALALLLVITGFISPFASPLISSVIPLTAIAGYLLVKQYILKTE